MLSYSSSSSCSNPLITYFPLLPYISRVDSAAFQLTHRMMPFFCVQKSRGIVHLHVCVCVLAHVSYFPTPPFVGTLPQTEKNDWNKWKNHFFEMNREVGMLHHEKERQQEKRGLAIPTENNIKTRSLLFCLNI